MEKFEDDLLKIMDHYGLEHQRLKLAEEYQELQDELFMYIASGDENNLLNEIADVFVLCLQFLFEYGYSLDDLVAEMDYKIQRQLKRMEDQHKKIESLDIECDTKTNNYYIRDEFNTKCYFAKHSKIIAERLNELIEQVNYLLEKSDEK